MDKKQLNERDICTKFITPALRQAGWDEIAQIREEFRFTKGRIIVRGRLVTRGQGKRADYVLGLTVIITTAGPTEADYRPIAAGSIGLRAMEAPIASVRDMNVIAHF